MKRGEVWVARLDPRQGAEAGKNRPVLIVQEDRLTDAGMPTVLVVPLTTRLWAPFEPMRSRITARDALRQDCHAMAEHVRSIDRGRLRQGPLTTATREEMAAVERSLRVVLGLTQAAENR